MDQRKAHMLARDAAEKLGWKKPICLHTPLLLGLLRPEPPSDAGRYDEDVVLNVRISSKMSKSKPESCIFVHDSPETIRSKMRKAYCPPKQEEGNPVLEHARYIVFPQLRNLEVPRPSRYGGPIVFERYEDLREAYMKGEVHPLDLKMGVAEAVIEILKPVREHFKRNPEPLERIIQIEVTR
jgi:tyrosyl-tRNA synthetase